MALPTTPTLPSSRYTLLRLCSRSLHSIFRIPSHHSDHNTSKTRRSYVYTNPNPNPSSRHRNQNDVSLNGTPSVKVIKDRRYHLKRKTLPVKISISRKCSLVGTSRFARDEGS